MSSPFSKQLIYMKKPRLMQKLLRALPHACVGQCIHHLYDGWNLEMGQVVAAMLKHGLHIGLDVRLEHEERLHRLVANRVINADDRHLGKAGGMY